MKEYEKDHFDYQNFCYFLEGDRFFKIPKNQNLNAYEKKYYQKIPSNFFDYLFCNGKCPFQETRFYFCSIDIESIHNQHLADIIVFFQDYFVISEYLILKNHLVFFYFDEKEIDFNDIIPSLNEDFNINLVLFDGGPIHREQPKGFQILFDAYVFFLENHPIPFLNRTKLVLSLAQYFPQEISKIRSILLKPLIEDATLLLLTIALLENDLNVTKTAKKAYMHRNTINNKIDFLRQETGFHIQKFDDAMAIYLLLKWK